MSTDNNNKADGGTSLEGTVVALRRYWWVVLVLVWLAIIGAVLSTARTPTAYVGRTSLIVSSNDRSPEQDAVLVQGYVSYFDNAAYQQQLLAEADVDSAETVTAEAAAASPIVVITATGSDAASAQANAIEVAKAFRDDINEVHARTTAAALATVQDQLDTALARKSKDDQGVIASLQDRIRQLKTDQDNVLQELQSRGGVSVQPPSLFNNLILAVVGGLFLGVVAALTLAKASPRLRSRYDVASKVGLRTLVELPRPRSRGASVQREQRLRHVANILRATLGGPGVVSVTQTTTGPAAYLVARGLAMEWATQGYATVLVRFSDSLEPLSSRIGHEAKDQMKPAEASTALSRMRPGPVSGMSILDLRLRLVGGRATLPPARLTELLENAALADKFVVIETPALLDSATAQGASVAADAIIMVIDTRVAKVSETRAAVDLLGQSGVVPVGAVLASAGSEEGEAVDGGLDEDEDQAASDSAGWSW